MLEFDGKDVQLITGKQFQFMGFPSGNAVFQVFGCLFIIVSILILLTLLSEDSLAATVPRIAL